MKLVRVGDNLTDKGGLFETIGPVTEKVFSRNVILAFGRKGYVISLT